MDNEKSAPGQVKLDLAAYVAGFVLIGPIDEAVIAVNPASFKPHRKNEAQRLVMSVDCLCWQLKMMTRMTLSKTELPSLSSSTAFST